MMFDYLTTTGPGKCKLTVGLAGNTPVAYLEEIVENPGTSVVLVVDTVATLVYHRYLRPMGFGMNDVLWITKNMHGDVSHVRMEPKLGRYTNPVWLHHSTEPIIQEFR